MKILIVAVIIVILCGCHSYGYGSDYGQAMDALETRQTLKKIEANTFWNSVANDPGLNLNFGYIPDTGSGINPFRD